MKLNIAVLPGDGIGPEIAAPVSYTHLATDRTPFPIIVNSNTAILKAAADPKELKIQVVDVDGKVVDQFSIKKP